MSWQQFGQYLAALGVTGLFAIAFIDAAAIPIVGGAEALTMLLAWRRPDQAAWIVLAASAGATLGALVFYKVGRVGGGAVLSRLKPGTRAWLERQVERHAFWALLVGVIVPPPFPTKPLVLTAGAVGTPPLIFASAVFIGRVVRFSALAYVGYRFGDQAATVLAAYYPQIFLGIAVLGLGVVAGRRLLRRRATRSA